MVHSSPVGVAVTIGLGAMTAVIAVWSLLAVDPTRDYLTLAALFLGRGSAVSLVTVPGGRRGYPVASSRCWV